MMTGRRQKESVVVHEKTDAHVVWRSDVNTNINATAGGRKMNIIFGMFSNTARRTFESTTILPRASRSRGSILSERSDVQLEVVRAARVVDELVERRDLVGRQLSEFLFEFLAGLVTFGRRQPTDHFFDDCAPLFVQLGGRYRVFGIRGAGRRWRTGSGGDNDTVPSSAFGGAASPGPSPA
jgi:hypothetical protein